MSDDTTVSADQKFNIDKVIEYFKRGTEDATDTLEELILQIESGEDVELARFYAALDRCREHLAGYHGPMDWLSLRHAQRYVDHQNKATLASDRRTSFRIESSNGRTKVKVPIS